MSKASLLVALACAPLLMGGACEKKSAKAGDTGAIAALDHASGSSADPGPVDTTPLQGIDTTKLDKDKADTFYKLVGSLSSPCGKAHSLRTSFTSDTSCKRAPFAVRDEYDRKYKPSPEVKIDTSKAPHAGADDAPIKIVEFFDYGCPHCKAFLPQMEQVLADEQGKVAEYFMMFPLEKHPDSKSAAQAALAAAQQGKFREMHVMLFDKSPMQDHEHVTEYAKQIGLDMGKFEAAYADAAGQVASDLKQVETLGLDSTPTVFFNDHKYEGPPYAKYIEMWIDEELAVNR